MHVKKNLPIILASLLLAICIFGSCALPLPDSSYTSDAYDYPVRPGTDEWKALDSTTARYEVCQIPEDTLKNMSTQGLVETVLDYPFFLNYTAYDDMQMGFDRLVENFNGLQELYTRRDSGTEVLKVFLDIDPAAIDEEWSNIQKGEYAFGLMNIEMLLMQEPVCESLTDEERQSLIDKANSNRALMETVPELYSSTNFSMNSKLVERATTRQYSGGLGLFW
jgi:hypothetical protein